jgi:hypothetical protein
MDPRSLWVAAKHAIDVRRHAVALLKRIVLSVVGSDFLALWFTLMHAGCNGGVASVRPARLLVRVASRSRHQYRPLDALDEHRDSPV